MPDSEKLSINLSPVDLGKIDVLVEEGHYSNRTEFVRTSIRAQLAQHLFDFQQAMMLHSFFIGIKFVDRAQLERAQSKHRKLRLHIIGALQLSDDIPGELADAMIESIRVRGIFRASDKLKAALASRIE